MTQIFGYFIQEFPKNGEYLTLTLSPCLPSCSTPLWKQNKISADFIADYFQTFIGTQKNHENQMSKIERENIKLAIKYITNELLENALKFHEGAQPFSAKIHLYNDNVIFDVTNSINPQQVELFQEFINKLINNDPEKLYLQAMIANGKEKEHTRSALGLLSIMSIYSARLGWKFEDIQTEPPITNVSTMACLNVNELALQLTKAN